MHTEKCLAENLELHSGWAYEVWTNPSSQRHQTQ